MARKYFYCDKDGTRTTGGGTTTQRTGAFSSMAASDVYQHPGIAISDSSPPVEGDVIVWNSSSSEALSSLSYTVPSGVHFVAANSTNCDQFDPATAAQVNQASGNTYQLQASAHTTPVRWDGVYIKTGANTNWTSDAAQINTHDTTFGSSGPANFWHLSPSSVWMMKGGIDSASGYWWIRAGGKVSCFGSDIDYGTGIRPFEFDTQGAAVHLDGCTLTTSNGAPEIIRFRATRTATWEQPATFVKCSLPAAWSVGNLNTADTGYIVVVSCDSKYQWFQETYNGTIDFVTDVYYNAHDTLDDGTTKGSFEFETNTYCTDVTPMLLGNYKLVHVMSAINTEAATKKKVRLRFVPQSGDSLDTADLVVYVGYPSGTYRRSWAYHNVSVLESGSSLNTETTSGNWTGTGLATNAYYFDVDMGSPNNGEVVVLVGLKAASVTVYFSWQLEFVA